MIEDHRVTQFSLSHPVSPLCICKSASKTADNGMGDKERKCERKDKRQRQNTKTRSASVREKRDDTCLFWGAACRLVAGPWLLV